MRTNQQIVNRVKRPPLDPYLGAVHQAEIQYVYAPDPSPRPCTLLGRADQLGADLANMRQRDYQILDVIVYWLCGHCQGAGRVQGRKRGKVIPWVYVTCGACQGDPYLYAEQGGTE